jgi:HEAT repeat protein
MGDVLDKMIKFVFGEVSPPRAVLEEDRYPRDAQGRLDLSRFTKPVAHYAAYFDEYLVSLGPKGPKSTPARELAYRKSVYAQWGLIAKGPQDALPYVLQLLAHSESEARAAAAGVLEAWIDGNATLVPTLLAAAEKETDPETLGTLMSAIAKTRTRSALPLLGRILRDPASRNGDVCWDAVEAIGTIARRRFELNEEGLRAADAWLREQEEQGER